MKKTLSALVIILLVGLAGIVSAQEAPAPIRVKLQLGQGPVYVAWGDAFRDAFSTVECTSFMNSISIHVSLYARKDGFKVRLFQKTGGQYKLASTVIARAYSTGSRETSYTFDAPKDLKYDLAVLSLE